MIHSKCLNCTEGCYNKLDKNNVYVGVFLEGLFGAVVNNKIGKVYRDRLRWFTINEKDKDELLPLLKTDHVYNITVNEYSSVIGCTGAILEMNHNVTHKCKVMVITDNINEALPPCDISNSYIKKIEEFELPYYEHKNPKHQIAD